MAAASSGARNTIAADPTDEVHDLLTKMLFTLMGGAQFVRPWTNPASAAARRDNRQAEAREHDLLASLQTFRNRKQTWTCEA
jgi:hypothetical protein